MGLRQLSPRFRFIRGTSKVFVYLVPRVAYTKSRHLVITSIAVFRLQSLAIRIDTMTSCIISHVAKDSGRLLIEEHRVKVIGVSVELGVNPEVWS